MHKEKRPYRAVAALTPFCCQQTTGRTREFQIALVCFRFIIFNREARCMHASSTIESTTNDIYVYTATYTRAQIDSYTCYAFVHCCSKWMWFNGKCVCVRTHCVHNTTKVNSMAANSGCFLILWLHFWNSRKINENKYSFSSNNMK